MGMYDMNKDIILTMDLDYTVTYISPSIIELLGYTAQEAIQLSMEQLLTYASLNIFKKAITDCIAIQGTGQRDLFRTQSLDLDMKRKDGSIIWSESRVSFMHTPDGKTTGIILIAHENTKGNDIGKLYEQVRLPQPLFCDTPSPVFVLDDAGRCLDVNPAAAAFLEADRDSIIGREITAFTAPESFERRDEAPLENEIKETDFFVNGKAKTLLISQTFLRISGNGLIYWIGMDISGRRLLEEALKASEENYRQIIANQRDLTMKINPQGGFIFVSPSCTEILGESKEDLLMKGIYSIVHHEDRDRVQRALKALCQSPSNCSIEHRVLTKNGPRWFAWSYRGLANGDCRTKAIVGMGRDITEFKALSEEKERVQARMLKVQKMEALGNLAGGIAHDFNKLLLVINGNIDLISQKLPMGNPVSKDIEEIKKAANDASFLTSQLLAFSRRQVLQPRLLDLNAVVNDAEKMLRRMIGEDIQLTLTLDPGLRRINADPGQLCQVITNIVINARESMPRGGRISIKTENVTIERGNGGSAPEAGTGKFVCLSIQDTGAGMDSYSSQRVFEPFFAQGDKNGLRLSVVYGIIKQHDGWIHVSGKPEQGGIFKIYLPAFSLEEMSECKPQKISNAFDRGNERILLVVDERHTRELMKEALSDNGYVVFDAPGAQKAHQLFDREGGKFGLLLSDIALPDGSGIDLADKLLSRTPQMHVLLNNGSADQKNQKPIIDEKGFGILQEPYAREYLLKAVKDIMEMRSVEMCNA